MTEQATGTRGEWLAARVALLAEEKELTRRSDELSRKRQALPWVPVEEDYTFETNEGTKTLAELLPSCKRSASNWLPRRCHRVPPKCICRGPNWL